jgi:hypothetical protein
MKILQIKNRGVLMINIQYDGRQYKPKNKSFRSDDYLSALNFILLLPDQYIMSCIDNVYDWAVKNNHPVLKKKNWVFC